LREAAAESVLGVLKRERVNRQHYPEPKRERISSAISNGVITRAGDGDWISSRQNNA